uniref:Putative secreted protein n=1 Tax=Amblyomma triste TaxID=251400 RepID=A0A023FZP5_AMBTT
MRISCSRRRCYFSFFLCIIIIPPSGSCLEEDPTSLVPAAWKCFIILEYNLELLTLLQLQPTRSYTICFCKS